MKYLCAVFLLLLLSQPLFAQTCVGGQIYTNEAYLHGRFEVSMRSVGVSGVVSSFFLYNLDVNCNWPAENNEIDIEMTGDDDNVLFTTHYPDLWYITDTHTPPYSPHDALHDYAIEWEPDVVRWFMDGELVNVQDETFVAGLIYPMRIMMNLWAAEAEGWVGPWNPASLPLESDYDYVRYYAYTPSNGHAGTDNNFTLVWEDEFNVLDETRWTVEEYGGFSGNYCTFKPSGVEFMEGMLHLQMESEPLNPESVPVTFSVDANGQNLQPSDAVFLNGSFNNWCGNCEPMSEVAGVWSVTIDLEPGEHEFLFTKNFWEENAGAPLGSECDFKPCDEWANYGLVISVGDAPTSLDTYCWGECTICTTTSTIHIPQNYSRELLRIYNLNGIQVDEHLGEVLLYYYSDGTVEKRMRLK